MDSLVVKVSELYEQVKAMMDDGMEFAEVSFLEEDHTFPDDPIPPSVHLEAFNAGDPASVVYDDVYSVSGNT